MFVFSRDLSFQTIILAAMLRIASRGAMVNMRRQWRDFRNNLEREGGSEQVEAAVVERSDLLLVMFGR